MEADSWTPAWGGPGAGLRRGRAHSCHGSLQGSQSGCCRGSPGGRPAASPRPSLPPLSALPALPALQLLPWPLPAQASSGMPNLSPLPALPAPLAASANLRRSPSSPSPLRTPARPPPPAHVGREDPAVSQPLSRLPGPCLGSLSRLCGARHRVSTGHRAAKQTSRQAGAEGTPGAPPSAPSLWRSNASSRKLPVTPLYPVRVDHAHCRQGSFINSFTQEAGTRAPNKPPKGEEDCFTAESIHL